MTAPIVATAPWVSEHQHAAAVSHAAAAAGTNGFQVAGVGWSPQAFKCCRRAFYYAPQPMFMIPGEEMTLGPTSTLGGHDEPKCPVCDPVGAVLEDDDVPRRDAALVALAQRLAKTSAVHTMLVLLDDAQRQGATEPAPPEGGGVARLRNPDDVLQIDALRRIKGFDLAIAAQASRSAVALFHSAECNPVNARLDSIDVEVPHVRDVEDHCGPVLPTLGADRRLRSAPAISGVLACAFKSDHACIGSPRAVRAWDRVSVATLERAQAESSRVLAVPLLARRHREQPAGLWTAHFRCHSVGADGLRYLWAEEGFAGEVEGFIASLIDPPIPTPHVSRAR